MFHKTQRTVCQITENAYICKQNEKYTVFMTTAVLTNGSQYTIPNSDAAFFKKLAKRMGWALNMVDAQKPQVTGKKPALWTDGIVGKWQDTRSTEQILQDIHDSRTFNDDVTL